MEFEEGKGGWEMEASKEKTSADVRPNREKGVECWSFPGWPVSPPVPETPETAGTR